MVPYFYFKNNNFLSGNEKFSKNKENKILESEKNFI